MGGSHFVGGVILSYGESLRKVESFYPLTPALLGAYKFRWEHNCEVTGVRCGKITFCCWGPNYE